MSTQISAIAISNDGVRGIIVTGRVDGSLLAVIPLNSEENTWQNSWTAFSLHGKRVLNVKFCAQGKRLISCASDDSVRILDALNGHTHYAFSVNGARSVAISPTEFSMGAIGSSTGWVQTWKSESGNIGEKWCIMRVSAEVLCLQFSNNGTLLACGSSGGALGLSKISTSDHPAKPIRTFLEEGRPIKSIVFTKDDSRLMVMSSTMLRFYAIHSSSLSMTAEKRFSLDGSLLTSCLSTDESCFVICTRQDTQYFNCESGAQLTGPRKHDDINNFAYLSSCSANDGRFFTVSVVRQGRIKYTSVATIFRPHPPGTIQGSLQINSPMDLTDIVEKDGNIPRGEGGFGTVYKGRWKNASNLIISLPVAIKVLPFRPPGKDGSDRKRRWRREQELWQSFKQENIVPFLGVCTMPDSSHSIALVSLWMHNGTVRVYLCNNPMANRRELLVGIARGLEYLHSFLIQGSAGIKPKGIAHGDIKADNVLVDTAGTPRLTDFGLSRIFRKGSSLNTLRSEAGGTPRWMAPELMFPVQDNVTVASDLPSDIYAFGMTCLEIMTNKIPFEDEFKTDAGVILHVGKGGACPSRPNGCGVTDATWNLMESCWYYNPLERPCIAHCLEVLVNESSNYRPLRLLSFDHGDLRSYGSLQILQKIFQKFGSNAKPCDYFDMIGGVGTGGLLALMLGRLQMTIGETIIEFERLCQMLSKESKAVLKEIAYPRRMIFSSVVTKRDTVREYLESLVSQYDKSGTHGLVSNAHDKCQTMVLANGLNIGTPLRLRDYVMKGASMPSNSEQLAVTMQTVLAASLRKSNPCGIIELLDEARAQFGHHRQICSFLSCGTAHITVKPHDFLKLRLPQKHIVDLENGAASIQKSITAVENEIGEGKFFRFDFEDEVERRDGALSWSYVMASINDRPLGDIAAVSQRYMATSRQTERGETCASKLSRPIETPPPPSKWRSASGQLVSTLEPDSNDSKSSTCTGSTLLMDEAQ